MYPLPIGSTFRHATIERNQDKTLGSRELASVERLGAYDRGLRSSEPLAPKYFESVRRTANK
jgi:hypothetical protein